ncbi:uncharacterized protein PV06_11523 [Exophiala oligosperma]|uniref:Uncharacterized protein n=1 Tax=Exophiala oligosperma TaxID=215243 RepID=A0A0D2D1V5_9EURO|nr:uncharacterized protein PV06_11523 [Exophiala oligosperma]KIW36195.1 hypothetical protein PV06_11523 [Exophiala oligosperma]
MERHPSCMTSITAPGHFTVDVPNGSGCRERYHLYPNGDNTVYQGGQIVCHPGEENYAIEHMNQYGEGVNQIPHGYQGAVAEHHADGTPYAPLGAHEDPMHQEGGDYGEEMEHEGGEEHEMGHMHGEEMEPDFDEE